MNKEKNMDRRMFVSLASVLTFAGITGCAGNAPATDEAPDTAATDIVEGEGDGEAAIAGDWWEALPRESWSQFEPVDVGDPWFSVYKLPGDVYAIYEDGQFEEVISYLILGSEKALLWDTGMGISDIKAVVDKLTDLPVTVLLSHTHHDHMGGMHQFDEVWCLNSPYAIERATSGIDEYVDVTYEVEEGAYWKDFPEGFDPSTYHVIGKAPTGTVEEGQILDLGGRTLEIIATPGHTADGIMLIDEANHIIWTGDTYYPAELYAFSEGVSLEDYAASMHEIADLAAEKDIEWIYASHNETVHGIDILGYVADDMDQIISGEATDYEVGEDGYRYYSFDHDVVIITEDE